MEDTVLEIAPVPEERQRDNAHVEQKNGSVVRTLLGEGRLDKRALEQELRRLCEDYSDYRNFCVPCKMLVAKVKRKDGKGFSRRYDKPHTPYARVLSDPSVPQDAKAALMRRKAKINGIELHHRVLKRLRRVQRMLNLPDEQGARVPPPRNRFSKVVIGR